MKAWLRALGLYIIKSGSISKLKHVKSNFYTQKLQDQVIDKVRIHTKDVYLTGWRLKKHAWEGVSIYSSKIFTLNFHFLLRRSGNFRKTDISLVSTLLLRIGSGIFSGNKVEKSEKFRKIKPKKGHYDHHQTIPFYSSLYWSRTTQRV